MNPLDLLLLRNGSQARLRTGSSHAISTNINEMMDQIPENNPKSGQIGTKYKSAYLQRVHRDDQAPEFIAFLYSTSIRHKYYWEAFSLFRLHHPPETTQGLLSKKVETTSDTDASITLLGLTQLFFVSGRTSVAQRTTPNYCLVPVQPEYQYVALSYIWGTKKMLMTERSNLTELQKEQALSTGPLAQQVARTIRDSIELVKLLGERYMWVDALCIVQDDGASKHHQITNMSSIYAAAKLTIISAQAADAWHGLRGLENISEPRSLHIRTVSAGGYRFVERLEYTTGLMPWCRRGWTFQEALFSPRRLIFSDDSVQWSCGTLVWTEDLDYDHKPRLLGSGWGVIGEEVLNTTFPDIAGLNQLVETYGTRQFTFAEDTLSAFAGFSTAISNIFLGGFIQGLPVMFLDAALLWKSNPHTQWPRPGSANKIYRKVPSKAQGECPPTWSWAGWATEVDYSSWIGASDYIRYSKTMRFFSDGCRTEPLVQWYAQDKKESEPKLIPYQNEGFKYRQRFLNKGEGDLSPGWTRLESDRSTVKDDKHFRPWKPREETPAFYYVHEDAPETEFWYPIPIIKLSQTSNDFQWGRYLSCRTQKGLFWREPSENVLLGEPDARILEWEHNYPPTSPRKFTDDPIPIYLKDQNGLFAGYLTLHAAPNSSTIDAEDEESEPTEAMYTRGSCLLDRRQLKSRARNVKNYDSITTRPTRKEEAFQVVAISKGHAFSNLGKDYDFVNILWVEWVDGIAYRKGLGRIFQHVWERQPLEDIELILG
ncbi:heterokaryon incompatibility protein-domain-containing protein [Fusarium solani]|uniref:Heterokaryon incompatibility protein-domain-containing protein n=1 Tax=Fusarium solani TaxID=169388 RepID=A0A9P9JZH4_FUSSL|nr:heterokaryon incompatibility protein-domain-containing protein [Fusarium solani]KAH7234554.1 heterokaryon incompatibility protein-domain-containing protein [Fusarium solani]